MSEQDLHAIVTEQAELADQIDGEEGAEAVEVIDDGEILDAKPEEAAEEAAEETPLEEVAEGEPTAEEVISELLDAPEHWNEDYRVAFGKVDRGTQDAWLEQSRDWQRGMDTLTHEHKDLQQSMEKINPVIPLLEEAAPYWQAQGMGVEQGLGQILQWGKYLSQNPAQAIPEIAKMYGVDLQTLGQDQPYLTPEEVQRDERFQHQAREMEDLKNQVDQQQYDRTLDFIGSFRNEADADGNPVHPHFDAVSSEITRMFQSGEWKGDLTGAYEKAIWQDPNVRAELIKSEQNGAVQQVVQQNTKEARRVQSKANQRVRHAQPGTSSGDELDDMTTEELVTHLARQQETRAAR